MKIYQSQEGRLPKVRCRESCILQFYVVFLNNGKFITKSCYPRKLDYLKSGFGKIAFCSFTLFSSIIVFYLLGLWEFHFGASPSEGVVVQGCDRAWRVECIMELKKNAGSPILDNENAVFFLFPKT